MYRSFNDKPVNEAASGPIGKELFVREQDDLLSDLKDIPKKACDRRVSKVTEMFRTSLLLPTLSCSLCTMSCFRSTNSLSVQEQLRFMPT